MRFLRQLWNDYLTLFTGDDVEYSDRTLLIWAVVHALLIALLVWSGVLW